MQWSVVSLPEVYYSRGARFRGISERTIRCLKDQGFKRVVWRNGDVFEL